MYNFEKLEIYNEARQLIKAVYILTKKFPKEETFGLISQVRRAINSVALNLAEGSIKTKKDFARFIDMSAGSLLETRVAFQIALDLNYITEIDLEKIINNIDLLFKRLMSLRNYLRRQP